MSSAPKRCATCAILGVIMIQYALMCGKLSSSSRATAMERMSWKPEVIGK